MVPDGARWCLMVPDGAFSRDPILYNKVKNLLLAWHTIKFSIAGINLLLHMIMYGVFLV
jgi:hypothetical protein